ncbi:MAG: ArnT family glycosyltransferase [Microgenomates group bacterium]
MAKRLFYRYWWIILAVITFALRLPSLFEPFTYGDEGIYLTLGQAFRKGLVWYRDIHDNKPPLLYLLAALAGNFSYFRLILFFWSFATIYLFFKLTKLIFKNKNAQILSTFIFAILTSIHTFEGNIGNAENFMMLPIIGGFYLYLKAKNRYHYFLTGVLFSLATLFKVPAAFDFVAVLAFSFLTIKKIRNLKLEIRNYFLLLWGFFLPILLTIIYYGFEGALSQYLSAVFFQNLPYLSSWTSNTPKIGSLPLPLLIRGLLVLGVLSLIFRFPKKVSRESKLILIWFTFSLFAALLSSRPYPHYLLQVIPPFALSFGLVFSKTKEKIVPLALSFFLVFSFLHFKFWHYPNISYYLNFYQFALGQKNKDDYFNYFGKQTKALYQTAKYLKLHTLPEEKIFVWSNQPAIYALADRLPIGRYTVAYHIVDFKAYQETIDVLTKNPPRYIIVGAEEKRPFPEFFAFLEEGYISVFRTGDFNVLKLKNSQLLLEFFIRGCATPPSRKATWSPRDFTSAERRPLFADLQPMK